MHPVSPKDKVGDASAPGFRRRSLTGFVQAFGFSISAMTLTTGLGVISNKIIAVWGGPELSGLVAVFRQLYGGLSQGLSFGADVVVVQWVSSGQKTLSTTVRIASQYVLIIGGLLAVMAVFLPKWIAIGLFGRPLASSYVMEVAVVVMSSAVGLAMIFVIAILNGLVRVRTVAALNIIAASTTAVAAYFLITRWASFGASLLVGFGNVTALIVGGWLIRRLVSGGDSIRHGLVNAVRTLVSSGSLLAGLNILATVVLLTVQAIVTRGYGLEGLALYSASATISNTFMMLFMSPMKTYVLPTLGGLGASPERSRFVNRALQFTLLLVFPCALALLGLRNVIIQGLYSTEFLGAGELLAIETLAIIPRTVTWVLAMALLSAGLYRTYAVTEVTRATILIFGCGVVVALQLGIHAVAWVFCAAYAVDLVIYLGYSIRQLQLRLNAASTALAASMMLLVTLLYLS